MMWEIVPRPEGKPVVTSRWLYKIKHGANGSIEKYKDIFVSIGFSQKEGVDCDETFAPVARYTSIRSINAIASAMGWKLHQMDVRLPFSMVLLRKKYILNNEKGLLSMERSLMYASWKRIYMDPSKHPVLGMDE